jgi:thioredoxin 1
MPTEIVALTDDTFDGLVTGSGEPYLVEFWSEWCAPCVALQPVLEEVAAEYEGKVRFAKVDIVGQPETTARFDVQTTPTMLIFRNGEVVRRIQGARPKRHLHVELDEFAL